MRHRLIPLALASAGAVLLSGCGSAWPASDAEERFVEHFSTTYAEHVVSTTTQSSGKWPYAGGELSAQVVLADDTPPELFDQITQEVIAWDPDNSTTYDGRGATANGLGVCAGDEQREAKQELRHGLYAEGLALTGDWPCTTWERTEGAPYQASVADFSTDGTTVRALLGEDGADLWVRAELREPWGSVDARWVSVPPQLEDTLAAVGEVMPIRTFEFTQAQGLRIAVPATSDLRAAQQAAEEAAGPDLPVEVVQGDLDPVKAAEIEALAPVADHVRAVPGVIDVTARPGHLVIAVDDPGTITAAVQAATTHPALGAASVELNLDASGPDDEWARHRYFWDRGGSDEILDVFVELVGHEAVSSVQVSNRAATPTVSVTLSHPLADGFGDLKPVLPDGLSVKVAGHEALPSVEFISARTLAPEDLTTQFTTPDLDQLASDWNAAP